MATDLVRHLQDQGPFQLVDLQSARDCYRQFRVDQGAPPTKGQVPQLLTPPTANAKLGKGLKNGIFEFGLSLAPAMLSILWNICRFSTANCRKGCVAYAGHGEMPWVIKARVIKTLFLAEHPAEFLTLLVYELQKVWDKYGVDARVRLNNFSDIPWETIYVTPHGVEVQQQRAITLFEMFPRLRFYDYTKWGIRAMDANLGAFEWPGNYRLTYSASEKTTNEGIVRQALQGVNTAVLFDVPVGQPLPGIWQGVQVIDGDLHDDRWLDPSYVIVGLRAKGRMRKGKWDMVRKVHTG